MRLGGDSPLTVVLILTVLTLSVVGKRETKSYTINTDDGPITVTETKVSETSSVPSEFGTGAMEMSGWSSSTKELLQDSKISDMSVGDLGGSLVLAIDKTAISKGLKKYIMDAIKKLPVNTKGIKIGLVEYTDRPYTAVSLKEGWSLDRIMGRLETELAKSRYAKKGGKIFDYVGLQAAYNELQKYGKASAPRIVMLLSSGNDAAAPKTEQWRQKLMKEWISLSEVVVDSSSSSFKVKEGGEETSADKTLEKNSFLTALLKSYSHSTIQYYKKIYGSVWEFYIVLKHYKKIYPDSWTEHLKAWFSKKYGSTAKFDTYLHRTEGTGAAPVSPEVTMQETFKKKYGSNWKKHFLIWKYKKLFGSKWEVHYQQHLLKEKYGKNWLAEWEKQPFKNKYGKDWEPHYVKWYFKKYRGATWIYSWKKWQFRQKHAEGSKEYVEEFMRWYFTYKGKGKKEFEAWKTSTKSLSKSLAEQKFRWFYYNLVFKPRKALVKYTKWYYRTIYGKEFLPKFKAWEKKLTSKTSTWNSQYKKLNKKLKYKKSNKSISKSSYKIRYGLNWRWYYTKVVYRRKYGRKWRVHFNKWVKTVWKKPAPTRRRRVIHKITWFKRRYGLNWRWYYTKVVYRRRYGRKWRVHFNKWVKTVWKKPAPSHHGTVLRIHHPGLRWHWFIKRTRTRRVKVHNAAWYQKRYGASWLWYFTRAQYQRRFGAHWRARFNHWTSKVWRRPAPSGRRLSLASLVSWRGRRTRHVAHSSG